MLTRLISCLVIFIGITTNSFGAEEGGMPQLNPEYWAAQIFWLILIFSILYIIVWKIFFPKIIDSIENRKLRVVNDLNEAQKLKDKAEKKLNEYNQIIEDAKKSAKKMLDDNKKKLELDLKNKNQKFNEEIEKELLNTEKEIINLKKSSLININKIAVEVSSDLVKKIIGSDVNTSNVSAVVAEISKKRIGKEI